MSEKPDTKRARCDICNEEHDAVEVSSAHGTLTIVGCPKVRDVGSLLSLLGGWAFDLSITRERAR